MTSQVTPSARWGRPAGGHSEAVRDAAHSASASALGAPVVYVRKAHSAAHEPFGLVASIKAHYDF